MAGTPSPLVLSTTTYGEASLCLKRYEYHVVERLVPAPRDLPPRMRKGLWVHKALAEHALGNDPIVALSDCADWACAHGVPEQQAIELRDECHRIVHGYLAYWGGKRKLWPASAYLAVEQTFEAALGPDLLVKATVDGLIRHRGGNWLVERKTTEHLPSAAWRAVDPQTLLQVICVTMSGIPVDGVIFDYLITREPPVPRVKQDGEFYAGTQDLVTTTAAFEKAAAVARLRQEARYSSGLIDGYLDGWRNQIVNDGAFYDRYEVYRPREAVLETLKDLKSVADAIREGYRTGHWRRLSSLLVCPRFCPYSNLCSSEYVMGRESTLRQTDFVIDDPNTREAR